MFVFEEVEQRLGVRVQVLWAIAEQALDDFLPAGHTLDQRGSVAVEYLAEEAVDEEDEGECQVGVGQLA